MDPLGLAGEVYDLLAANYWVVYAFLNGLLLGKLWGLRESAASSENHMDTLRHFVQLLGHFQGAVEVLDENDLTEEAAKRGNRYAKENLIDLETRGQADSTILDRVRDRFSL